MEVTVDEFCKFLTEGWPGDSWYLEDYDVDLWESLFAVDESGNYKSKLPGTKVPLESLEAAVLWQGDDHRRLDPTNGDGYSLVALFKAWKKKQTDVLIVAEIPRDKVRSVVAVIEAFGGKIKR